MKIKYLILLIIIIHYESKEKYCSRIIDDCLSCKDDICLLCDVFRGFYPNYNRTLCNSCDFIIENCIFSTNCGSCQICSDGYSLCNDNCKKNIENCFNSDTCINRCLKCNQDYILLDEKCHKVTNIIENCDTYQSLTHCKICKNGYLLKNTDSKQICSKFKSIHKIPLIENCLVYLGNKYSCNSCKNKLLNTYEFLNFNLYNPYKKLENKILNTNNNLLQLLTSYKTLKDLKKIINKNDVCENEKIDNCLISDNNLKCTLCEENYYIKNGKCVRIQQSSLLYCLKYEILKNEGLINGYNKLICTSCINGYYLKDSICISYKIINNCIEYHNNYTQCTKCNNLKGYKLIQNNCIKILNFIKIDYCIEYKTDGIKEGNCSKCKDNYNLVNNNCLTMTNCEILRKNNYPLVCNRCKDGYKLTNNLNCERIPPHLNCLKMNSKNDCLLCKSSYFSVNNKCTNVKNNKKYISNCKKGGVNWFCEECKENFIKIPKIYDCFPKIQNCLYYNINGTCLLCDNGKIGVNCNEISHTSYCKIYKGNNCVSCYEGYYFDSKNNSCIIPNINNSNSICSENPVTGYIFDNLDPLNYSNYSIEKLNLKNNCNKCIVSSFIPDTLPSSLNRCVPKLSNNSNDPYSEGDCLSSQFKVKYENSNPNDNILTCRSIDQILGDKYKIDKNCAIYKNNLNNYTDFSILGTDSTQKTLCAICYSGYEIPSTPANSQCKPINNCKEDKNHFGGCFLCNNNTILDISGDICVTKIDFCEIISGPNCLKCNDKYYGRLNSIYTNYDNINNFSLLGYSGSPLPINYRDSNKIKIPSYRFFFISYNSFSFVACLNNPIYGVNSSFNGPSYSTVSGLNDRTLAVIGNNNYPSFCRAGYYMSNKSNFFDCISLNNTTVISNLTYNNFLTQIISKKCGDNHNLIILSNNNYNNIIGGPFCYRYDTYNNIRSYDVVLNISPSSLCQIYLSKWNFRNDNPITKRCLLCLGYHVISSNNVFCQILTASDKSIPCKNFDNIGTNNNICVTCPTNYIIVNNACIKSNQYYNGANISNTLEYFKSSYNCELLSWNINNPGIQTNFSITYSTPSPTCLTCKENYIMDYSNFRCVIKNKFNFKNCFITQKDKGCIACKPNYIHFGANIPHYFCINKSNSDDEFYNKRYESNCDTYKLINNKYYQCTKCKNNYKLENYQCNIKLINNIISNCKEYYNSNCKICNENYYLNNNNICILGKINNCLGYKSQYICEKCKNGYTLWTNINKNSIICINYKSIKLNFGSNCETIKSNNANELYCYCDNGYIPLINNPINNSICLPNYTDNCIKYDKDNNTKCIECNSSFINNSNTKRKRNEYILLNNKCIKRLDYQLISNCIVYLNNEVKCEICKDGYYIDGNFKCIKNPIGPINCKYSTDLKKCELCNNNFYLNSYNVCTEVKISNIIVNCYKYNINQKCELCNRGYLINNNNCRALTKEYFLDINNICKFDILHGYPFNKCACGKEDYYYNNILKKCIKIHNCIIASNNGTCKKCMPNTYYNKLHKSCTLVNTFINNCIYYNNKGLCSKCKDNHILDKNKCIDIPYNDIINNCNYYSTGPKCILCKPGQKLINGKCQQLEDTNIFYPLLKYNKQGLICNSGKIMNIYGNCVIPFKLSDYKFINTIDCQILKYIIILMIILII